MCSARIVSGAASGAESGEWLSSGHRKAKTVTNNVVNRWSDGPDSAQGVRARLAQQNCPEADALMERVDDAAIEIAIQRVRDVERRWLQTPPGGRLRLGGPLSIAQRRELVVGPRPSTNRSFRINRPVLQARWLSDSLMLRP